jgi:hypothetical protein
MDNKGQVTIFVLSAIVIVVGLIIFFLWSTPNYLEDNVGIGGFDKCIEDAVGSKIFILGNNGGFVAPEFTYNYDGKKYVYYCYTPKYYELCSIQVSLLKNLFTSQLEKYIREDVDNCYRNFLEEFHDNGYDVDEGNIGYTIEIDPGTVRVQIDVPTSVGNQRLSDFSVEFNSKLYELIMFATNFVQFESYYGNVDLRSYELLYPEYTFEKVKRGDGTALYDITHTGSRDNIAFASRSLVRPAGYGE